MLVILRVLVSSGSLGGIIHGTGQNMAVVEACVVAKSRCSSVCFWRARFWLFGCCCWKDDFLGLLGTTSLVGRSLVLLLRFDVVLVVWVPLEVLLESLSCGIGGETLVGLWLLLLLLLLFGRISVAIVSSFRWVVAISDM